MSTRRVKYNFKTGENVLCFEPDSSKAKVLYDAKILDVSVSTDKKGKRKPSYLIHFLGWNNSWDRVVPESFLLKNTDDNRVLMKKLEGISQRIKSNKLRMKKIDSVLARFFQRRSGADSKSLTSVTANEDENTTSDEDDEEDEEDIDAVESGDESFNMDMENSVTQSSNAESSDVTDDDEESERTSLVPLQDGCMTSGCCLFGCWQFGQCRLDAKTLGLYLIKNRNSTNDENVKREPVCLDLSESLKRKLERDCYLIKRQKKRLKLPAVPNVVTILEGYVKCFAVNVLCVTPEKQRLQHHLRSQKQQTPDKSIQLCKEMVDGLRVFFDFTLPLCLLYESEMTQFKEVTEQSLVEQKPSLADLKPPKVGAVDGSRLNLSGDLQSTRQKHKDDLTGNDDDAVSMLSDNLLPSNIKTEAEEHESPARRVTRNSSGTRRVAGSRASLQSTRTPTRSSSRIGGAEMGDEPHRLERETRQSCARARQEVATPSDPPVIENVRSSVRVQSAVKAEHSEATHPPCLHFESEPSEVSSQVSQLLTRPEIRAICSQKEEEKEVSSIFAWKLVPDDLQAEVPLLPSFIYGAHHLLRLFVPLPDLLSRMDMPASVETQLVKHLQLFLDHLTSQCEDLFTESSYVS